MRVFEHPEQSWQQQKKLKLRSPRVAGLRDLFWEVSARAFGSNRSRVLSEDEDYALQVAAVPLVEELRGGEFIPPGASWSWQRTIDGYRGPKRGGYKPIPYWNPSASTPGLRFKSFTSPTFPNLAIQARIGGPTKIQIHRDHSVDEAETSGHPLLLPALVEAARSWQIDWSTVDGDTALVAVRFDLEHCREEPPD